jgi:DnaK suppressor protein
VTADDTVVEPSKDHTMSITDDRPARAALRLRLQQRAEQLRAELIEAQHDTLPPGSAAGEVQDQKDRATHAATSRLHEAESDRDRAELAQVEAALARLNAGQFGQCADCGEPIGAARLAVLPAAECCAACQAERERHPTPARHG